MSCTSTLPTPSIPETTSFTSRISSGPNGQAGVVMVIIMWILDFPSASSTSMPYISPEIDDVNHQFRIAHLAQGGKNRFFGNGHGKRYSR